MHGPDNSCWCGDIAFQYCLTGMHFFPCTYSIKSTVLYQPKGQIVSPVVEYWGDLVTQCSISAKL